MRLTHFTLAGLCIVLTVSVAMAKDKKPAKEMDPQAMMEVYQKLATPGEPHKLFATLAGNWTTTTKEWMEPGKPPTESTGTADMKMEKIARRVHYKIGYRIPASEVERVLRRGATGMGTPT